MLLLLIKLIPRLNNGSSTQERELFFLLDLETSVLMLRMLVTRVEMLTFLSGLATVDGGNNSNMRNNTLDIMETTNLSKLKEMPIRIDKTS